MKRYTDQQIKDYISEQRKQAKARGVTYTTADLGNGPAADYNKGPGNWTGD